MERVDWNFRLKIVLLFIIIFLIAGCSISLINMIIDDVNAAYIR